MPHAAHLLCICCKVLWNSREHRKGRFVRVATLPNQHVKRPRYRLFGVEPKNISWWDVHGNACIVARHANESQLTMPVRRCACRWVAFLFTIGSICWVSASCHAGRLRKILS